MKRYLAAAFSLFGLVFAMGCVGTPESDTQTFDGEEENVGTAEDALVCRPFIYKCPVEGECRHCTFDPTNCSGECICGPC